MRYLRVFCVCCLLAATGLPGLGGAPAADARATAEAFGSALRSADAGALRSLLPAKGKVQVSLDRLGPHRGSLSAGQVETLFRDFFRDGSIHSYELAGLEQEGSGPALARSRAGLTDTAGRLGRVELRLSIQPEGERWVIRAIRETAL